MDEINKTRSNYLGSVPHMNLLIRDLRKSSKTDKLKLMQTLSVILSSNDSFKIEFYKQGGIHMVLKNLQEDDWEIAGTAFHILESCFCQKLENKLLLTTQETFRLILEVLKEKSMNHKKSSLCLIASIVAGNILGQALTREIGFLHHLMELFYDALESLSLMDEENLQWYLLCTAIKVCICNPQNVQNQFLTSLIIPKAIMFLNDWTGKAFNKNFSAYVQILLSLIIGIITENRTNQLSFCMYDGVQLILRNLSILNGWQNAPANISDVQEKFVSLLFTVARNSPANYKHNFFQGAVPLLLQLLQKFDDQQKVSVLMALTYLMETSADSRKEFLTENGISKIVMATVNVSGDSRAGRAASILLKLYAGAVQNEKVPTTLDINSSRRNGHSSSSPSTDTMPILNTKEAGQKVNIVENENGECKGGKCLHHQMQDTKKRQNIDDRKEKKPNDSCQQMRLDGNKNLRDIKFFSREDGRGCYLMQDTEKQTEVDTKQHNSMDGIPKCHKIRITEKEKSIETGLPDGIKVNGNKSVDHDIVEIVNKQPLHCCLTKSQPHERKVNSIPFFQFSTCSSDSKRNLEHNLNDSICFPNTANPLDVTNEHIPYYNHGCANDPRQIPKNDSSIKVEQNLTDHIRLPNTANPFSNANECIPCYNPDVVNNPQVLKKNDSSIEVTLDKTMNNDKDIPKYSVMSADIRSPVARFSGTSLPQRKSSQLTINSIAANKYVGRHNDFENKEKYVVNADRETKMSQNMVKSVDNVYSEIPVKEDNINMKIVSHRDCANTQSENQFQQFCNLQSNPMLQSDNFPVMNIIPPSKPENSQNMHKTVGMLQNTLPQTNMQQVPRNTINVVNKYPQTEETQNSKINDNNISKSNDTSIVNQPQMKSNVKVNCKLPGISTDTLKMSKEIDVNNKFGKIIVIQSNKQFPVEGNVIQNCHPSATQFHHKENVIVCFPRKPEDSDFTLQIASDLKNILSDRNSAQNTNTTDQMLNNTSQQTNTTAQIVNESKPIRELSSNRGKMNTAENIFNKFPQRSRDAINTDSCLSDQFLANKDKSYGQIRKATDTISAPLSHASSIFSDIDHKYISPWHSSINTASSKGVMPQRGNYVSSAQCSLKSYSSCSIHTPVNIPDPIPKSLLKTSQKENLRESKQESHSKKQLLNLQETITSDKKDVYEFINSCSEDSVVAQWSCNENIKPVSRPRKRAPHNMLRFTQVEVDNLVAGVAKYGLDFKAIRRAYTFHRKRTAKDLYLKWKEFNSYSHKV